MYFVTNEHGHMLLLKMSETENVAEIQRLSR